MGKTKHRIITRFRRADTGRFVKESYADRYPDRTIRDRMKVHIDEKKKGQ